MVNTSRSLICVLWHFLGLNFACLFRSTFLAVNSPLSMYVYMERTAHQILINHPELDMSVRSMYTYIDKGLFTARNVDLKRQAKFKPRKCHKTQIKDREVFTNRTYADFCSLELNSYVQMDTVKSSRDSQKTLLTMIFTEEKLFLAFLNSRCR